MVELEFFQIFLPYSFRLIGPQTKQGCMPPCSAEIGLEVPKRENFSPDFDGFWLFAAS